MTVKGTLTAEARAAELSRKIQEEIAALEAAQNKLDQMRPRRPEDEAAIAKRYAEAAVAMNLLIEARAALLAARVKKTAAAVAKRRAERHPRSKEVA